MVHICVMGKGVQRPHLPPPYPSYCPPVYINYYFIWKTPRYIFVQDATIYLHRAALISSQNLFSRNIITPLRICISSTWLVIKVSIGREVGGGRRGYMERDGMREIEWERERYIEVYKPSKRASLCQWFYTLRTAIKSMKLCTLKTKDVRNK